MPPFWSSTTSKAVGSLLSRRIGPRHLIRSGRKYDPVRCFSNIGGIETPSSIHKWTGDSRLDYNYRSRRQFLGCGDGEEGGVLSKVYEEKRVLGYSPEQLFDVVAAVDLYHGFVPWCQRSDIIKTFPDGSFDAELEIGFKFLVESYVSHVELERAKRIKAIIFLQTIVSNSSLFDHLINIWEFNPGPVPGSCNLYFLVDFKFRSPIYRQVASVFFKEVVSKLVGSFNERCRLIYGPGVPIHEHTYGQRA
ncbi:coenzyme Q-binding protein COQ10 homolog, mitochondrial isoform X1 [Prunus dulcis]|uniref:coenzyme Q-binding protein COQ10 homolog, mitochondrial isoform X1 n=1 Tax=Prunus dulcis TaxID=3755 RepID=UPI001482C4BD|nr:coenzyme Q-binding protein COQ10 homolog, mitochondrial isoform X1 [Prunus dulcis]